MSNQYPLLPYNFVILIDDIYVASFSECSGLSVQTKVTTYQEGGRNDTALIFPETTSYGNVTLKRGTTGSNDLINWQLNVAEGLFSTSSRGAPEEYRRNVFIVLLDEKQSPCKIWELIRALPVRWVGPDLKASGGEVAIESLELAHEGIVNQ